MNTSGGNPARGHSTSQITRNNNDYSSKTLTTSTRRRSKRHLQQDAQGYLACFADGCAIAKSQTDSSTMVIVVNLKITSKTPPGFNMRDDTVAATTHYRHGTTAKINRHGTTAKTENVLLAYGIRTWTGVSGKQALSQISVLFTASYCHFDLPERCRRLMDSTGIALQDEDGTEDIRIYLTIETVFLRNKPTKLESHGHALT
jgi:hypothetical protein